MRDLRTQLHDYVESTIERVDVDDVVAAISVGQVADPRPVSRLRPVWVAAGAALLVVLSVGVPLVFFGSGDSPTVDESAATTAAPMIVPSVVGTWQQVRPGFVGPVDTVDGTFDMTAVGSRLFAVGFVPGEDDRQNGVVLTSDDGVNWVRLAVNDPALTLGAVLMHAATEGGPGLVAVGVGCEAETGECALRATAWTSIDGTSWTRTPEDATAFGDGTTQTSGMADVADTSHGLVAVGSMKHWTFDDGGVEELVTIHPAAWISDDGITWERSWEGTGSAIDPNDLNEIHVTMDSVVEGPDGLLVGVGATLDENGVGIATAWTSRDGRQWERIEPDNTVFTPGTVMLDVALGEHGYVAVGTDNGTNAAIWQSPDGVTWARIDTASQSFDGIRSLDSVAALDAGYVTVGPDAIFGATGDWVTVWTSPDGVTWDRIPSIAEGYASGLVVGDGGIAVSGGTRSGQPVAAVWLGPRYDPDAPPLEPVPAESGLRIGDVAEGVSCEAIAAEGFTYPEAVSYWLRYELTEDFNLDVDGAPCADAYTDPDVAGVFGEPDALAVYLSSPQVTWDSELSDTFTATGPAVDAGLICAEGTTEFIDGPFVDNPMVLWRWEFEYTCGDGTGTFVLGEDDYIEDGPSTFGVWSIVTGTGDYVDLRGGGATPSSARDATIGRLWAAGDGS